MRVSSVSRDITRAISATAYKAYEKRLLQEIEGGPIPQHLAIIMDGNRRFAQEFGLHPTEGHEMGKDKLEEVMNWCLETGIKVLTVYAFSTENLNRKPEEVDALMRMFAENFRRLAEDERIHKHKIHVQVIGQRELLPEDVQEAIAYAEKRTKDYDSYFYNIAIAYGGREEIVRAIRSIVRDVKEGKLREEEIDEKLFSKYLYTSPYPDPDLVLRTSGEERISNFLLWQLAYSELYFTDVYWPGFRKIDFLRAIRSYQMRQRRYGR
ncbi:MAG: di-trans,poly-cis-decaprenylcistransferase [Thermoplasmata archaeon]|nr:di-trans,poly-cis-decaprenylcistransferase [Thermoplasmata archaeon]